MRWLVFLFIAVAGSACGQQPSPFTFVCRNKYCTRIFREELGENEVGSSTAEVCKLNCGDSGSLWPFPTGGITWGLTRELQPILPSIEFDISSSPPTLHAWVNEATAIFESYLIKMNSSDATPPTQNLASARTAAQVVVRVQISGSTDFLGLYTDESYTLDISAPLDTLVHVVIGSRTYFGARHGLETLSQLIAYDAEVGEYVIVRSVSIADRPVYTYRGLTLDTSRNFVSLPRLRRLIDGLSYNKMNMFHWHITDSNSFPLEIAGQPNLTLYGAHAPHKVYTQAAVRELVHYAKIRGVKIVPEFDQPAHVGAGWQWGSGEQDRLAVCVEKDPWHANCVQPPCGQLNIANDAIYPILGDIYRSMLDVFDDDLFHMGGDEVDFRCYNSTPEIVAFMQAQDWGRDRDSFMRLWDYFQTRSYAELESVSNFFFAILWTSDLTSQEYIRQYIDPAKYVIQIWTRSNDPIVKFLVENQYRVIFSNVDALYLDCGYQAWIGDSGYNWCSPYKTWQSIYENSPYRIYAAAAGQAEADDALRAGLLLGASAPLWMEQATEESIETRFWPRGAALGERLWSDPQSTGVHEATVRMVNQNHRLIQRGLQTDGLQPEWCWQHENKCTAQG